jgi:dolichyl-phosphate beta-glucosyltransferase
VRAPLSRFAVVGAAVTIVDVVVFVALWRGADFPLLFADLPALVVAALVSHRLHRAVTFRHDPYGRWLDRRGDFVVSGVLAGVVDVGVLAALAALADPAGVGGAVAVKAGAVGVAGGVRWVLHRRVLFDIVRAEQVARPSRAAPEGEVRLSVVIPAYDDAGRIAATVQQVRQELEPVSRDGGLEVIVVDDGSTDATAAEARAAGADEVLVHPANRGKGAAVRTGMAAARGRTVAFTDSDLAYSPAQLLGLLAEVEAGWDVVVGSRRHAGTATLVRARRIRELGGRAINWLTHAVLLGRYRDTQCGLKAFRRDVAGLLFSQARIDGFAFDVELFVMAERFGLGLAEVPVQVENTTRSTVRVVRDAVRVVRDLFRIRRWARLGLYRADDATLEAIGRGA